MAEQNSQIENITNIDSHLDYQAVIIGAGVAGIYQIKRLADLGVRALVLDANADLGGPVQQPLPGARFDSESYTYSYSFSKEVLDEWHWTEVFAAARDVAVLILWPINSICANTCSLTAGSNRWCSTMRRRLDDSSGRRPSHSGRCHFRMACCRRHVAKFEGMASLRASRSTHPMAHEPLDLTANASPLSVAEQQPSS